MIINGTAKPKGMQKCITLNKVPLEQVTRFKYLGSWITEDERSDENIRARLAMAKAAFWQKKELLRSNIKLSKKMKILNCTYSRCWIMVDIASQKFFVLPKGRLSHCQSCSYIL